MTKIKKLALFLNANEKKEGYKILIIIFLMSLLESFGVFSVFPFISIIDGSISDENKYLKIINNLLYQFFNIKEKYFVFTVGIFTFIILTSSIIFKVYTIYKLNSYVEMLRHSISNRLISSYLSQSYSFFLNSNSGVLSKNLLSDVDHLIGNVYRPAILMITGFFLVITFSIMLFLVDPYITVLITVIFGGIYYVSYTLIKSKVLKLGHDLFESNEGRFLSSSEAFGGIKDIKLLGSEEVYLKNFFNYSKKYSKTITKEQLISQLPNFIIEWAIFGGLIVVLLLFIYTNNFNVDSNEIAKVLPIITLLGLSAYKVKPAVQNIFQGMNSINYGGAIIDSLEKDIIIHKNFPKTENQYSFESNSLNGYIKFKNLYFRYSRKSKYTLSNINLNIPLRKMTGVIGSTGSGKTTLVDLILGLLEANSGFISIDNKVLKKSNINSWQKKLGYVPQNIYLLDSTLTENIAFGIPKSEIDFQKVIESAKLAQIHDPIQKMPQKYDTNVGERGVRLSGGQRQRIGIARALYRNPSVLILDEATSALDTITEKKVMNGIYNLSKSLTIIIIAHRLETIRNCDQLVILKNGLIDSVGDYQELKKNSKLFTQMLKEN